MNIRSLILAIALLVTSAAWACSDSVPEQLQKVSVTIRAGTAEGSGTVFTRKDAEGKPVSLIWTAGHVVAGCREEHEILGPKGRKQTQVEFSDVVVIEDLVEAGRTVGKTECFAEVLRYSNADTGEDLAVLRVRKHDFRSESATFFDSSTLPAIGAPLYHVGSLHGSFAPGSVTSGVYSYQGRLIGKILFDQISTTALPGSSGGGVFLADGRYVGMLVRTAGETVNLMVPVRRMRAWAKFAQVEWALDESVPMPTDSELETTVIEPVKIREFKYFPSPKSK